VVVKLKTTILFDLGGTLARYYTIKEFPPILERAIGEVQSCLREKHLLNAPPSVIRRRVREEDHESPDYRSRPLEDRLTRIFGLDASVATEGVLMEMCRRFMVPIFALGKCYDDTLPALEGLTGSGFRLAIVSNTSWGCPSAMWRGEVKRLGLDSFMDVVVFDRDLGWRKPAKAIFESALKSLGVVPKECLFVGDEPKWDLEGPRDAGIDAVLIDRNRRLHRDLEEKTIRDLSSLNRIVRDRF